MRPARIAVVTAVMLGLQGLPAVLAQAGEQAQDKSSPAKTGTPGKLELNFFPIVGGDSDVGFGIGEVSDVARLGGTEGAFRWRIEDAAFVTFKVHNGAFIVPFLDIYTLWTVPNFGPGGRFRLEVRPSYTDERTLGYYGIGNASNLQPGISDEQREYRRIHPTLAGRLRMRVVDSVFVVVGSSYTQSWLDIRKDSLLVQDRTSGSPEVRQLLGNFASHGVELLELGMEYDTRDNETVTRRGQYHSLIARTSPALASWTPYEYVQIELNARFYSTPIPRRLSIAFRVVGDAFLGTPPFYELARFDDTPAVGGGKAIRGVPAQRYHGKVKLFENLEVRSQFFSFSIKDKPFILGGALFFDSGRTWTEAFHSHTELDGAGLGLKYGVGAGLRLQEGKTFVVRADLAWSPDAQPIGGYFSAGEIF